MSNTAHLKFRKRITLSNYHYWLQRALMATFGDALIQACIVRTENLDGRKVPNKWDKWADEMTDGQWNEVFNACMHLTRDPNPSFPQ